MEPFFMYVRRYLPVPCVNYENVEPRTARVEVESLAFACKVRQRTSNGPVVTLIT